MKLCPVDGVRGDSPPIFLWLKAIKIERAERSSSYLDTYRNNSHVFLHGENQLEM